MALGAQRHCLQPAADIAQPECEVTGVWHTCATGQPHFTLCAIQVALRGPEPVLMAP